MKATRMTVFLLIGIMIANGLFGCDGNGVDMTFRNGADSWQITVPQSWGGYYRATQNPDGAVDFYFYGQSEFSQSDLYAQPDNGLYFFSITNSVPAYGDVIDYGGEAWLDIFYADNDPNARQKSHLGTVNGTDYYIAARTEFVHNQELDWGIGGIDRLFLIDSKGTYIDRRSGKRVVLDLDEFEQIKTDIIKARQMLTDLGTSVRASFKAV
jgi:hypothetical protein